MIETVAAIVIGAPLLGCLPLLYIAASIGKRAEKLGLNPGWYLLIALLGWFVGLIMCPAGAGTILVEYRKLSVVMDPIQSALLLLSAFVGASVGGSTGYVLLWMRTVHHPDFEELDRMPPALGIADIHQLRDGDDFLSK